ncbi:hypothetical protein [Flavobacterium sp. JP2137]|uniref:hypothetical protein n=1 Tax=Flavobacterium sp. JP2137 TaxID=3414510 RepID=UPI003D2F9EA9
MKHFLSAAILGLFLLVSFSAFSQKSKQSSVLIPYNQDGKWGLSRTDKSFVIAPQYDELTYHAPYFFARKGEQRDILSADGAVIGSFDLLIGAIDENRFLIFKEAATPVPSDIFSNRRTFQQYETSFLLYKLENDQLTLLSEASNDAYLLMPAADKTKIPQLYVLTKNGLSGVYDVAAERFLIEPAYKHLHFPLGNVIIAFNEADDMVVKHRDGTTLPTSIWYAKRELMEVLDNGYFTTVVAGADPAKVPTYNYKLDFRTPDGTIKIKEGNDLKVKPEIDMLVCETIDSDGNHLNNLYDLEGNLLLADVLEYDNYYPNLLHVYGAGYENFLGLYNYKKRKMVWKNDFPKTAKVKIETRYGIPKIAVDTTTYFIDDQGRTLMRIGQHSSYFARVLELMKTIKVYRNSSAQAPYKEKKYTAFRDSKEQPFAIYDENYRKVTTMDEYLSNIDGEIIAFRKGNNWGLSDVDQNLVPVQYDSITYSNVYYNFRLYKDGKAQLYLKDAKKILPAEGYDDGIAYRDHNFFLGIKYERNAGFDLNPISYKYLKCQVDLLDDKGKVLYSFKKTSDLKIDFALTASNQIIAFSEDNQYTHFFIHDTQTKKITEVSDRFAGFERLNGRPVIATFYTDKGQEVWNINTWERIKTLNESRGLYKSKSVLFQNGAVQLPALALIEVVERPNPEYERNFFANQRTRTETVIGYMSVNGTFYGNFSK